MNELELEILQQAERLNFMAKCISLARGLAEIVDSDELQAWHTNQLQLELAYLDDLLTKFTEIFCAPNK